MVKNNINTNSVKIKKFEVDTNYRVYAILNGVNSLSSNIVKVKLLNEKLFAQHYDHSALSNSSNLYGVVNVQHYDHSNLKNRSQWKIIRLMENHMIQL